MYGRRISQGVFALGVVLASSAWADYAIIDLGPISGSIPSGISPMAINNNEVIVGSMYSASGLMHAAYYDGTLTELALFMGASDISDTGYVVGGYRDPFGYDRSVFVGNGVTTYMGTLGGTSAIARAVNNNGDVVGGSSPSGYGPERAHAFLYSSGSMVDLGTLGGTNSNAYGINNYGSIVGVSSTTGNSAAHPFLYSMGSMSDLGTLGGTFALATAINDNGQVVGYSYLTGNGTSHAFIYDGGTMTDLGVLAGGDRSAARAINNNGDVVGDGNVALGADAEYPFLYSNGVMQNLNALLPANSGWVLLNARDINDYGEIVGEGNLNGVRHGYLLAPGC